MRSIDSIFIHCSATPASRDIGVAEIRRWHLANGWSDIGYHFVIRRGGKRPHIRPQGCEPFKIGFDGGNRRLLQHHLAQPDAIGIRHHTAGAIRRADPPWQGAGIVVIPFKKLGRAGLITHSLASKLQKGGWYAPAHALD